MTTLLLDTDACIEIIRGNPAPLDAWPEANFAISTVSRFEILSGLRQRRSRKLEKRVHDFLQVADTRLFDEAAADQAVETRIYLDGKGQPIGAYDLLLAGHALSLDMSLLTGNLKDFGRVPELDLKTWER